MVRDILIIALASLQEVYLASRVQLKLKIAIHWYTGILETKRVKAYRI